MSKEIKNSQNTRVINEGVTSATMPKISGILEKGITSAGMPFIPKNNGGSNSGSGGNSGTQNPVKQK
jgi:hypothetical protein